MMAASLKSAQAEKINVAAGNCSHVERAPLCSYETFGFIICYTYGYWPNLADLCDENTNHVAINSLGDCVIGYEVILNERLVAELNSSN